jgi:DNA (cytosine-5)-methyltransferase 1
MSERPVLYDLFCAAGGAAMGYHRAGFRVIGWDINPQPHYPRECEFRQGNVLDLTSGKIRREAHAVHASPPCSKHTMATRFHGNADSHADLIEPTRALLDAAGLPYIIENVVGAPIRADITLCGTMFGLKIAKHRIFECSFPVAFDLLPPCDHSDVYDPWHGKGRTADQFRQAQDTPWIPMQGGASRKRGVTGDLMNAIPPAFTEYLGRQLMARVQAERLAA